MTKYFFAVQSIMMNNSLINKAQHIPPRWDFITAHFLRSCISCISGGKCVVWFPALPPDNRVMSKDSGFMVTVLSQDKKGKGRCEQMHQQYLQKVTRFPQGTCLSLKQTRKELISALIRVRPSIGGELQSVAFLPRSGCTWGRGD